MPIPAFDAAALSMTTVALAFAEAGAMVARADPKLVEIVALSLRVSLAAVAARVARGAARRRRARGRALSGAAGAGRRRSTRCSGCPPSSSGLGVYLLLSRAGPARRARPPVHAHGDGHRAGGPGVPADRRARAAGRRRRVARYREQLARSARAPMASALALLHDLRFSLVTIVLAAFGRAIAEVGAVMIVGGNIDGVTRVMTTAIALETSKGDLPLALGLGIVLLAIVLVLNVVAHVAEGARAAPSWLTAAACRCRSRASSLRRAGGRTILDRHRPRARGRPAHRRSSARTARARAC